MPCRAPSLQKLDAQSGAVAVKAGAYPALRVSLAERQASIACEIANVSRYFGESEGRGARADVSAMISASLLWAAPAWPAPI